MTNTLQILYRTKSDNEYKFEILTILIFGICSLFYIAIKKTKEYKRYKKIKMKEYNAKIVSFDGAKTRGLKEYHEGNIYSYIYTINDKTYKRENYISKETYNKNDEIEILYNENNPEDSISKNEFEKITIENVILYYVLLAGCIILALLFILILYLSK